MYARHIKGKELTKESIKEGQVELRGMQDRKSSFVRTSFDAVPFNRVQRRVQEQKTLIDALGLKTTPLHLNRE